MIKVKLYTFIPAADLDLFSKLHSCQVVDFDPPPPHSLVPVWSHLPILKIAVTHLCWPAPILKVISVQYYYYWLLFHPLIACFAVSCREGETVSAGTYMDRSWQRYPFFFLFFSSSAFFFFFFCLLFECIWACFILYTCISQYFVLN